MLKQHLHRINFCTLAGAVILFFLPWTNIQCSGRDVATQSGVQAIYGGVSLADDLQAMVDKKEPSEERPDQDELGFAYFIATAAAALLIGLVLAAVALFRGTRSGVVGPGAFAAVALVLLVLEAAIGFPVNRAIAESNREAAATEDDEVTTAFAMAVNIKAERTTWSYLELALLVVPGGLLIYRKLPEPDATPTPA